MKKTIILNIFLILLTSGCESTNTDNQKTDGIIKKEIPKKMITVKIEPKITKQEDIINTLGSPTDVSAYDANLYGENMNVIENHTGQNYTYNTCDMSFNENKIVTIKTLLIDKNAPTLEYLLQCDTDKKSLYLSFFDGKLNSYSFH